MKIKLALLCLLFMNTQSPAMCYLEDDAEWCNKDAKWSEKNNGTSLIYDAEISEDEKKTYPLSFEYLRTNGEEE